MSFLSYLLNGISLGSVYAIIALGYTMVYGIAKMLNFAHGDVIMVGAYVTFTAIMSAGLPPLPAVLLSILVCTLLGIAIETIAYRPLLEASSSLAVLITAIGVSYFLQNMVLLIFGANPKSFQSVIHFKGLSLAGGALTISAETIVTILCGIVIMIALTTFISRTKAGQAMLAVSEDKGAAQLMGINVNGPIALTFAIGSGLAAMGASFHNIQNIKMQMTVQTIGNDKMNQLRHVRFFRDKEGVLSHMKKHAALIRPKFQLVERILEEELGFCGIARWTEPKGGYFISLDTQPGCAKRVISLCRDAGVVMTPAGATYPYGIDPEDSNIRIAPTYPTLEELEPAARILCLCIKIATIEKMIAQASEQEAAPQKAYAIAQ